MKGLSFEKINKSKEYLSPLGNISYRVLFGGYSLAVEGIVFAIVNNDGELYLRACEASATYISEKQPEQLLFSKRGRNVSLNYFHVDEQLWKQPATLLALSAHALDDER